MLRRSQALVFLLAILFLVPCSAPAQSQGQGGYWDRGHWIGYMPPHLKQAQKAQKAEKAKQTQKTQEAQKADKTPSKQAEPTKAGALKQTRYAGSVRPDGNRTRVAMVHGHRGMAGTPQALAGPVAPDEPMVDPLAMAAPGSGEPCNCGGPDCGEPCDGGGPCGYGFAGVCRPRWFWIRTDYLGWWASGMEMPPLVVGTRTGREGTSVLFGGEDVSNDARSGGRFGLGMWLDPCHLRGIDVTYLTLGRETTKFAAAGSDYTLVARPYFDISTGQEATYTIDNGDTYDGWVSVAAKSRFQGVELLYRRATKRCVSNVDFLIGWRWLELKDRLLIESERAYTDTLPMATNLSDLFDTKNSFNGVELGVEWRRPIAALWTFEMLGKVALGNTNSVVRIDGQTIVDGQQPAAGGLLTQDSNIGTHTRNSFATVTELGVGLRRRFTCNLELTFGYTFVYWSDVLRAGDQVDLDVDLQQTTGRPTVPMDSTDFWAQGLHFGLEYAF